MPKLQRPAPNMRTLKRRISSDEIMFSEKKWKDSFERYIRASRKNVNLSNRLYFAEVWIKIMQEQTKRGVLDPQFAYDRAKKVAHLRPHIEDAIFIRGIVASHWEYGFDFLKMLSDYSDDDVKEAELEDLKRRYYFSEFSENESKRRTLF